MPKESFTQQPNIENKKIAPPIEIQNEDELSEKIETRKDYFGKERYTNVFDAGSAARKIGITSQTSYVLFYKEDPLLPASPESFYREKFPGWNVFLGKSFYETWAESVEAAKRIGIKTWDDYKKLKHLDLKLRTNPYKYYKDFSSKDFLLKKDFYETWAESVEAAKRVGIKTWDDYRDPLCRNKDKRLRSNPEQYYKDFIRAKNTFSNKRRDSLEE